MDGKVRLVVAVVVALAVSAGGVPIAAQQSGGLPGARALSSSIQGTAVNWTNSAMANTPIRCVMRGLAASSIQ